MYQNDIAIDTKSKKTTEKENKEKRYKNKLGHENKNIVSSIPNKNR